MKKIYYLFCLFLFTEALYAGDNVRINDFYRIYYSLNDGRLFFFPGPDTISANSKIVEYNRELGEFASYLFDNYSHTAKKRRYLMSLLPDTININHAFDSLLSTDKEFAEILIKSFNKDQVKPIKIDSLCSIASRFFLVHRNKRGQVIKHFCTVINEAQDLPQSDSSPYYNAFCYMAIRSNMELLNVFDQIYEPYAAEVKDGTNLTDERLDEIKHQIFKRMEEEYSLRDALIKEYSEKKDLINFKLVH